MSLKLLHKRLRDYQRSARKRAASAKLLHFRWRAEAQAEAYGVAMRLLRKEVGIH